jgi:hypothetical protein
MLLRICRGRIAYRRQLQKAMILGVGLTLARQEVLIYHSIKVRSQWTYFGFLWEELLIVASFKRP